MTKTLTEQWREGTLPDGAYYIVVDKYEQNEPEIDVGVCYNSNFEWWVVKEVLSAVPRYDEWQESQKKRALWFEEKAKIRNRLENKIKLLEEQLNYALETMGQVAKLSDNTVDAVQCAHAICLINERLKEMEGVK